MIKNKILYIFCAGILATTSLVAQTAKQKRADKYYEAFAYVKAASLYEELAKQKNTNDQVIKRLADSYNHSGNYLKAEEWYSKLYLENKADPEEIYSYSQVLKANGKEIDAEKVLEKFYTIKGGDSRAIEFNKKKTEIGKLKTEKPYFTVNNIEGNSTEADFSPTFWNDKVLFVSGRQASISNVAIHTWNDKPFLNLFVANRDANKNFTEIKKFEGKVNTKYHEGPSCFTKDGNTIYFTRNNYFKGQYKKSKTGVNMLELYKAVKKDGKWVTDKLNVDNDEYSVGHPTLSSDEKTLYFVSDMPGGLGGTDIWKATINADGTLGAPVNVGSPINTEGNEMFPFMSQENVLYFSSNGHLGFGELDVFAAQPAKDGSYNKVMNLGVQVNTGKDDFGFVLDKESKFGYLSSNRDGGVGDDDIYAVTAARPLKVNYFIKGTAFEKGTTTPLTNSKIDLKDSSGNVVKTITTNETGAYEFEVEPQLEYVLAGTKEKYFDGENKFNTNELGEKTELIKDLNLEKDPGMAFRILVTDGKTKEPIQGVSYKITDLKTGQVIMADATPATGDALKPLTDKKINDALSYKIELVKEGYFPKTVNFNQTITKPGIINAHDVLDLTMDKEVKDLRDLVVINDIRFDLNKFNIRPDAAAELDKVVAVMNKYPEMVIELGSHTDCRASVKYNATLSDKRAKASAAYIKGKITNPARITGKGYGESKLLNGCACEGTVKSTCTEEEHQQNRRTEFKILSMGANAKNVDVKNNSTNSFDKN